MPSATRQSTRVTLIDLEFDTAKHGAPLGDIVASLNSLHELLEDIGAVAGYPNNLGLGDIQIAAIEMRSPLKIKLSLLEISADAVKAFRGICQDIIFYRERRGRHAALAASEWEDVAAKRLANIKTALDICSTASGRTVSVTEEEAQRLYRNIVVLQNAEVPLTRIDVKEE
jgi:hypothetical protein